MRGRPVRPLLLPAAWLYGGVIALRNAAFDRGLFRSQDVGIPVISVGNVSAGGTGKTPLVEGLAKMLLKKGFRPGILSRGYGRDTTGFRWVRKGSLVEADAALSGDEPVQMALNVPEAFIAVDEDRVAGARTMITEAEIDVLLLDDGFQHRWIARSFDVVVMTAREIIDGDALIPAGRQRESLTSLRRADTVVVTGCTDDDIHTAVRDALGTKTDLDMYYTYPVISALIEAGDDRRLDSEHLKGKRVLAVSGIGNPASFKASLVECGMIVPAHQAYPDHHVLTSGDISDLALVCRQEACEAIVMTQKDAVRMSNATALADLKQIPVYHTLMHTEWLGGSGAFERAVLIAVQGMPNGT